MPATTDIHVKGAKELERAFRQLRKEVVAELRPELLRIGDRVRLDAEQRAFGQITNIGNEWGRMRVGAAVRGVYIAPKTRRHGGSPRPNLAGLLLNRAMLPAVEANESMVIDDLERLIDISAAKNGFYG